MIENVEFLIGACLGMLAIMVVGVAWAIAWGMAERAKRMPNLLAQVQEGAKLERSMFRETQKLLLSHCNRSALIQYAEVEETLGLNAPKDVPIPGHGDLDPVGLNGTKPDVGKALAALQHKKAELEAKLKRGEENTRFGHLAADPES